MYQGIFKRSNDFVLDKYDQTKDNPDLVYFNYEHNIQVPKKVKLNDGLTATLLKTSGTYILTLVKSNLTLHKIEHTSFESLCYYLNNWNSITPAELSLMVRKAELEKEVKVLEKNRDDILKFFQQTRSKIEEILLD